MAAQQTMNPEDTKDVKIHVDQLWKCGDPYTYSLPAPEKEPWSQILDPLRTTDTVRCHAWKDEVGNMLIFAGLFSAVVTAFAIESQKTLKQEPVEILLTQLLVQMGSPTPPDGLAAAANTSTLPSALWFLSLVLSLSTSAVGIVALQWLREHERPYGGIEPQIAVSLHRMQAKSLDEWFVPQIFAILPMALQTALVLFLIGLTISMWHTNRTVAIFVVVAVGFTLFFLLATTVLPALQSLFLLLPIQIGKKPRSPCPYRSPQSWIFHRLISAIVRVVRYILKINWDNYSKIDSRNLTSAEGRSGWNANIPHGTGLLFRNKAKDSWLEHGVAWLFQRDFEFMPSEPRREEPKVYSERPIPLYDAVHALLDAKQAEFSHSTITAIDYCLDDVVKANVKGEKNHYARFLHQLSIISPLEYAHGLPKHVAQSDNLDLNVLQEDATLRLFSRRVGFNNLPSGAALKTIEICLRLTGWMYGENEARLCSTGPNSSSTRSWIPVQWAAQMILASTDIDESIIKALQGQVRLILLGFFRRTMAPDSSQAPSSQTGLTLPKTLDDQEYLGAFLSSCARIVTHGGDYDICNDIRGCIQGDGSGATKAFRAAFLFCRAILMHGVRGPAAPFRRLISSIYKFYDDPRTSFKPELPVQSSDWERFKKDFDILAAEMDSEDVDGARNSEGPFEGSKETATDL